MMMTSGLNKKSSAKAKDFQWERMDSNHRSKKQQIYSLPPLATRELSPIMIFKRKWSWWTDSNPRPADYKSAALPTELHQQSFLCCAVCVSRLTTVFIIAHVKAFVKCFFQKILIFLKLLEFNKYQQSFSYKILLLPLCSNP